MDGAGLANICFTHDGLSAPARDAARMLLGDWVHSFRVQRYNTLTEPDRREVRRFLEVCASYGVNDAKEALALIEEEPA